jgi:hypothetical protein
VIEVTPCQTSSIDISLSNQDIPRLFDFRGSVSYRYVGQEQSTRFGEGLDIERVGSDGFSACIALVLRSSNCLELAHLQPESNLLYRLDTKGVDEALMIQGTSKSLCLAKDIKSKLFESNCSLLHVLTVQNDTRPFGIAIDAPVQQLSIISRNDIPNISRYKIRA